MIVFGNPYDLDLRGIDFRGVDFGLRGFLTNYTNPHMPNGCGITMFPRFNGMQGWGQTR